METKPHLLVVDDDRDIRNLIRDYLLEHGYHVSLAADGRQMHGRALANPRGGYA